jgi:hypothetical protein
MSSCKLACCSSLLLASYNQYYAFGVTEIKKHKPVTIWACIHRRQHLMEKTRHILVKFESAKRKETLIILCIIRDLYEITYQHNMVCSKVSVGIYIGWSLWQNQNQSVSILRLGSCQCTANFQAEIYQKSNVKHFFFFLVKSNLSKHPYMFTN